MLKVLLKSAQKWHEIQVLKACHRSFTFFNARNSFKRLPKVSSYRQYRTSSITISTRAAQEVGF